ncbi:MAG: hypothetical protein IJI67_02170 [Clostridia bacterium]|nr:hypothetical protein [Clostridia bacterium]
MKRNSKKLLCALLGLSLVLGAVVALGVNAAAADTPDNGVSLTVGDNIVSNYYIDTAYYKAQGCDSMEYTYNGTSNKEEYTEVTSTVDLADTGARYEITAVQAAAQIAEPTEIVIYKGGEAFDTFSFSTKDYCDKVIAMADETIILITGRPVKLNTLCKSIIAYAKAAQGIFPDYMSQAGAVAIADDYSDDLGLDSVSYTPDIQITQGSNVRFKRAAFICASSAGMRFYYTGTAGTPTVSGPAGITWSKGNGYIQINGIKPVFFDETISVSLGDASISMNVLDYAGTILNNSAAAATQQGLARALIVHNDASDEYFVKHSPVPVAGKAATCTAAGYEAYFRCTDCGQLCSDAAGNNEISEPIVIPALGHSYNAVVTEPTCTTAGYTTYTCTRCGDNYTGDTTAKLGHSPAWQVTTGATTTTAGSETQVCTRCNTTLSNKSVGTFSLKFENTEDYLYRVGNANAVKLGSLFGGGSGATAANVSATVSASAGNATGTFTVNASDWRESTIKFNNIGVVTVTLKHGTTTSATLKLEVVAGTNYAAGSNLSNVTSNNAVLLGDVKVKNITINNGKTLFGNGFSVTDNRTTWTGTNGYINMNGNGTIDNAVLLGAVYETAVTSGIENEYYAPGVWITGNANIYNSYVSECKNAIQIDSGVVNIEGTTIDGGAIANVDIGGGTVTFKDCTTSTSTRGGLHGLAVRPKTGNCTINIEGTFNQYNWLTSADMPSTYSSVMATVFNDPTYAYTYADETYVNFGIFFVSDANDVTQTAAANAIHDSTGNDYGYIQKTFLSRTATVYTPKATMGSPARLTAPAFDPTVYGQSQIRPSTTFDYTTKNYQAKTEGSNTYCYYNTGTKKVDISFEQGSSKQWDTSILTAKKNGNTLPYTVTMGGTDYSGKSITFTETGEYELTYTYTDPYNYNADGSAYSRTYTQTVKISVSAVNPEATVHYADFAYTGAAGTYDAKKVTGSDNKTYVMPDVSATSDTIGSTTAGGKTIYYPIVTVGPTDNTGNTAYQNKKGYYFAPVFSELNITDYNQSTGAAQYSYNKSATKWPHEKSSGSGPDTAYFGCVSGEKVWGANSPYARSTNSQYYQYGKNSLGPCYTTTEIEKDNPACNHLVQYYYVANDGTTYYYYIYYKFTQMTYDSTCVTGDTLVTMADGSQKPIAQIKQGDMVMSWSLWNGCYEAQPVTIVFNHGTRQRDVLTLAFSDGTEVRTIYEHGFFDADLNTYAYITEENVQEYVGDRFIKQLPDGSNTEVELTGYSIGSEMVGSYSLQTAYNDNFMVENMLSITGEDYPGRFEYFDIGEGMQYDAAAMQADIEQYGLYTYEDWADYLSPTEFELFNGQYFKVLVGKGVFTHEDIIGIIENNLNK